MLQSGMRRQQVKRESKSLAMIDSESVEIKRIANAQCGRTCVSVPHSQLPDELKQIINHGNRYVYTTDPNAARPTKTAFGDYHGKDGDQHWQRDLVRECARRADELPLDLTVRV